MSISLRFIVLASLFMLYNNAHANYHIYLTFDDGPLEGTENVIQVLEKENVPAIFFMIGAHAHKSQCKIELIKRIQKSPHMLLGNHSYSHANNRYKKFYSNAEQVIKDMQHNNTALGLTHPTYSRLPGRDVFKLTNQISRHDTFITKEQQIIEQPVYQKVFDAGFILYGWDHEWSHEGSSKPIQSPEQLMREIEKKLTTNQTLTKNHLILLMHDQMFQDKYNGQEKLTKLIQLLKQNGYKISSLQNYQMSRQLPNE